MIEETIGVGGMGAVYRAVDQKFGSLVAIKETLYTDTHLAEAFEREARLLNGLHHPILPHVFDYFTDDDGHFLVMEYIEGEDLSAALKRGEGFASDTVLGWTLDLLDGLDYLHSQDPPIIHRDIKPNNLKLTSRGKLVLLDFGMAKEASSNTFAARSVHGYSRRYSPLEQIEGSGTDMRSDIFSLGATVYHLLTGEPPVDALRRASTIVAGKPDPFIAANSVNPMVPVEIGGILTSALALSPEKRYESAKAMADALEHAIEAGREENEAEQDMRRHRAELAAGATAAIAGLSARSTSAQSDGREASAQPAHGVMNEEDVLVPEVPIAVTSFNARRELRRRLGAMLPEPVLRIRRPSRPGYAVWVPLVILFLGVGLYGTYQGLRSGGVIADAAPETAATDSTATIDSANPVGEASPEPQTEAVQEEQPPVEPDEETLATLDSTASNPDIDSDSEAQSREHSEKAKPVAEDRRERSRQTSDEASPEAARRTDRAQASDRTTRERRASPERPRRVVRPAFEQPPVSSIEGVITGVPYDRRRRFEDRQIFLEEERRRRQLRRMRRNRIYEPF